MSELSRRLADGEREAFAELYDACADRVHHYLAVRLRSYDDASDVLHESFLRLARSHEKFEQVENPIAYVFGVAKNEAARHAAQREHEKKKRQKRSEQQANPLLYEPAENDLEVGETASR